MADPSPAPEPASGRLPGRALRGALGPLVGYFDRRFDDVHQRLARIEAGLADVQAEVARLGESGRLDAETTIELQQSLERAVTRLADQLEAPEPSEVPGR